jgi:hypothetical protein
MNTLLLKAFCLTSIIFLNIKINNAQVLYAITQKASDNMDYLSTVDPLTGSVSIISSSPLAKYVSSGLSSIDPINNRFFFMSAGDTLYNVDLTTGNLISKNKISVSGTHFNVLLEFNCQDTTLYAITQKASDNMDYLSTVNPLTGSVSIISSSPLAKYVSSGLSSIDPINNRFFFMSAGDTLYSVDLTTGNLINKNKISVSGTHFNVLLEYDNSCSLIFTGTNKYSELISEFKFFPNPFSNQTTFEVSERIRNSTLTIYNSIGQRIKEIKNLSGESVILERNHLPNGIYIVQLTRNGKVIATEKIIITD